jgi:hypothetical protein
MLLEDRKYRILMDSLTECEAVHSFHLLLSKNKMLLILKVLKASGLEITVPPFKTTTIEPKNNTTKESVQ